MASVATPNTSAAARAGEAERTRLLIEAAAALLDEEGLEGLTIRAVLARTGLARRAFYERFNGKDDLVLAVFDHSLRIAAEYFRAEAADAGEPVEALRRIITGLVMGEVGFREATPSKRSAALSREHLRLAEARPQELQVALGPLLDVITQLVERGIDLGVLRPCEPRRQANLIYNLVSATIHVELISGEGGRPDRLRRAALAETIWEFCRRAVIA